MSTARKKEDLRALAAEGYADPIAFCKIFLPRLFPGRIPWLHRGLWAVLTRRADFLEKYGEIDKIISNFVWKGADGVERSIFYYDEEGKLQIRLGRYTMVMLPRGFSKTTIAGTANSIRNIVYQLVPFTAYVSEASDHAAMQLSTIKYELETNALLREVFGELKPAPNSGKKWNEDFFETTTGLAMVARGRGGQIRGLNHKGNRPKLIIFDDVEDRESVRDEKQRGKAKEWAYGDALPAIAELDSESSILAIGTLLHPESLLSTFEADEQFTVIKFGAYDKQGELLWAEMLDEKKLAIKKTSFVRANQLHTFYMEYFNEYRVPEGMKFKPEFIKHEPYGDKELVFALWCDPAISKKKKADDATITVVGMAERGTFYVVDQWGKLGPTSREIIDKYFEFQRIYKTRRNGFEANGFQGILEHLFREEMFRKRQYFEITPVTHSVNTDSRVELILQPRYAAGYVKHVRVFAKLETQLLDWNPPGHHNDYPDGVCSAIEMLDPHAALALDPGAGKKPEDDEYEPLDFAVGGAP